MKRILTALGIITTLLIAACNNEAESGRTASDTTTLPTDNTTNSDINNTIDSTGMRDTLKVDSMSKPR